MSSKRIARLGILATVLALIAGGLFVLWPASSEHTVTSTTQTIPSAVAIEPGTFAPGACMKYQPTAASNGHLVFLDAGHGGIDPGGVGSTQSGVMVKESTTALAVALQTSDLLRSQGYTVVLSRTTDSTVVPLTPSNTNGSVFNIQGAHDDVAARDACANAAGAALLIGIYFDAGVPTAAGSLAAYDTARPFAAENLKIATLVQTDVLASMNKHGWEIPDDGVQSDEHLGSYVPQAGNSIAALAAKYNHIMLLGPAEAGYFETPSQMPGMIIEPLYVTDPFEGTIAASALGQKAMADGIAKAVLQYFAKPKKGSAG